MAGAPDLTAAVHVQTETLVTTLSRLGDLDHPSLCRGWTRAHVVAHLARNADGITNLVRAAHGEPLTMYASAEARDADIDRDALRPAQVTIEDCITTGRAVARALTTISPDLVDRPVERLPGVAFGTAGELAAKRLREVVYHHVDLRAGFTFDDVPADLLDLFLTDELDRHPKPEVLLWLARGIRRDNP